MNIRFKNILKTFFAAVLASVAFTSCEDWNQSESVKFEYTTLEQKNPELYQAYLESLKAYRTSEHGVMVTKFDNPAEKPVGQAQHVNAIPDSVDYVILMNADNLSETVVAEMNEMQETKGTKYLYEINYSSLVNDYKAYAEEWQNAHEGVESEDVMKDLATFLGENVPELLKIYDKYPYDGISVVYSGIDPSSCTEAQLAELTALQTVFFTPIVEWLGKNEDANFFFEGTPQFLAIDNAFLEKVDYILLDAITVQSHQGFTTIVDGSLDKSNIPSDRFIVVVTTISIADPTLPEGIFTGYDEYGNKKTAIEGAAEWVVMPSDDFKKLGVCVENAQNDYFNLTQEYQHIRRAISIMNPSYNK